MSEDYWYPFYPTRYQRETMHLTAEQDGAYRRLIDYYMTSGRPLPDNDVALRRIAGVDASSNAISIVKAFFKQGESNQLRHKMCDLQLAEQSKRRDVNRSRAKKGAEKRWGNQKDNAPSIPEAMLGDSTDTNTDTDIKGNTNVLPKKPKKAKVTLEELSVEHIWDWLGRKRGEGKHLHVDENQVLEVFKDYCRSKDKRYSDYVAALRNAFDWDRFKKQEARGGKSKISDTFSAIDNLPI